MSKISDKTPDDGAPQIREDESLYRSLPAPAIELLLDDSEIERPNAVVESIEASIGIPLFTDPEFEGLREQMRQISEDATRELQELLDEYYSANGNHTNGHHQNGDGSDSDKQAPPPED